MYLISKRDRSSVRLVRARFVTVTVGADDWARSGRIAEFEPLLW